MRRPARSYGTKKPSKTSSSIEALGMIHARLDRGLPVDIDMLVRCYRLTRPEAERMVADASGQRERLL